MEERSLAEGGRRIKFTMVRMGDSSDCSDESITSALLHLGALMSDMEGVGGCPVLPDGLTGGNGGLRVGREELWVSRSGKKGGQQMGLHDWVKVVNFDEAEWKCHYYSSGVDVKPSSDTPLLWLSTLGETSRCAILHGHAIDTEEDARLLKIPISTTETLFSTREDWHALRSVYLSHPASQCVIRKGHGFFLKCPLHEIASCYWGQLRGYLVAKQKKSQSKL